MNTNGNNKHSSDMKEQMLKILTEVQQGNKSPELALTELLGLFSVNSSIFAKAEMINALTNTMKVNRQELGENYAVRDIALEKLLATLRDV